MVNATLEQAASTQIYNSLNLAPIVLIVIVAGLVIGILVSFSAYEKINRFASMVGGTLWYTILGGLTFGVLGAFYYIFETIVKIFGDATESNPWILVEYGLYGVAIFGGFTLTGFFVSKLLVKGMENRKRYNDKQYLEEAEEIYGSDS